jgi:hypothetical protein
MYTQIDAATATPALTVRAAEQDAVRNRARANTDVSTFRLYLLRGSYLLIVVGLAIVLWPDILEHALARDPRPSATPSLLAGVSLLALVGIRYPLQMLPLLLFELLWKSLWLLTVALPLWSVHPIDADTWETVKACLMGVVIFPITIPWRHVLANYVFKPGERWS